MQRFSLIRFHQGWKLNKPRGCQRFQNSNDRSAFYIASQLTQCFEHWIICFLAAKTLDALPASNPYLRPPDGSLVKYVNESRFTDSRLAGNEYHLPLAPPRFIERTLEFGHRRLAANHFVYCTRGGQAGGCGYLLLDNLGDELITAPGKCLYENWF